MKNTFLLCLSILMACNTASVQVQPEKVTKPKVSFTFDDGVTNDILNYPFEDWNERILLALDQAGIKAMFFVTGSNKTDTKGQFLLNSWDSRGHCIANHTFSHPNYNSQNQTVKSFEVEFLKTDAIISKYPHYTRLFRFPYLKEGDTKEKVAGMRAILQQNGYKNGAVTIDASDWYVNSRLQQNIKTHGQDPNQIAKFKAFYIAHILDRARYYEGLSYALTGRHINHTLLLHHNLTSALFLSDLIDQFKQAGWEITDASDAFQDPVFNEQPNNIPAGESLIWALAKASGKYDAVLRYPAEDSQYEAPKMDSLGL